MIQIQCRTNLDLLQVDKDSFPTELPAIPRIGDRIESKHLWGPGVGARITLQVYAVTWNWSNNKNGWIPTVELNLPTFFKSMSEFYEWYGKITGRGKSYFI